MLLNDFCGVETDPPSLVLGKFFEFGNRVSLYLLELLVEAVLLPPDGLADDMLGPDDVSKIRLRPNLIQDRTDRGLRRFVEHIAQKHGFRSVRLWLSKHICKIAE